MLEHVYIHGPDITSSRLGTLGRSLTKLQVISVSHASKDEVQALLRGPSADSLRYVEVDCFARTSCGPVVCKQIWLREITGGRSYVELRRCPPLLSLLHNGTGYAHTWTSAQGWQRIRRTCDNQVKLKLDGLQALFYADLAASIRSSTGPLSAAHAGGRGRQTDDCNVTAADLRLVLKGGVDL
jgi:hypothetical protein